METIRLALGDAEMLLVLFWYLGITFVGVGKILSPSK